MSPAYGKVATAALELPVKGRAKLAEQLLRSLEQPSTGEIERAWAEEAERRLKEHRTGKSKPLDGAKVLAKLRARFA